jgi:site-specific DNA-cytosine methylase
MAKPSRHLLFDIDLDELEDIQNTFGATQAQFKAAYNRALSRTAVTIRALSNRRIKEALQAKNQKALRKRIQTYRLNKASDSLDALRLWFGLNDMPVGHLKGRSRRLGSKSSPKGAIFTPSGNMKAQTYPDGFVAKLNKRRSIYQRVGEKRYPVKEARLDVSETLMDTIEDEIFDQLPDIFMKHFETDLKGRIKMNLN